MNVNHLTPYQLLERARPSKHKKSSFRARIKKEVVIKEVCDFMGTEFDLVNIPSRKRPLPQIRFIIMAFLYKYSLPSLKEVGNVFGKDHTTVIHGIQSLQDICDTEPPVRSMVRQVAKRVIQKAS